MCQKTRHPLILLDTDIGCDCDDAGAMAVLHALADMGETEILAVTHTTSTPGGPACVDRINRYYGRPGIPIGALEEDTFLADKRYDVYGSKVAERFPGRYRDRREAMPAVPLMRRILSRQSSRKVTLVAIGQLRNIARLLQSQADAFSEKSGIELVGAAVEQLVVMGGCFSSEDVFPPNFAEYNILCDVPSAQLVMRLCPCPVVFCGYEIGFHIRCGLPLLRQGGEDNPVRYCYLVHSDKPREAWDPATVLYAVRGLRDYWRASPAGIIEVTDDGVTVFRESPGGLHRYLITTMPAADIQRELDELIVRPPLYRRQPLAAVHMR